MSDHKQIGWYNGYPSFASTLDISSAIEVTTFADKDRKFIDGLPSNYRDALGLWVCHYCGTQQHGNLYKCPNCGGDRR